VVCASAVEGGRMSPGDGIATGSVHFSDRYDLHPFLNVVTKCGKDGRVRVGVMNTRLEALVIPVRTKYGSFSWIVDVAHHSEHPFCVAVIYCADGLHPLGQEEIGKPDKKKKTTAKKKTAQETESADQTGPELAPWLVGLTTVTNTAARIAHLISVFKLKDRLSWTLMPS
jgi:hypothetical protein